MRNKGIYLSLWKKYLPAIRILLKKSETADQILELYKHEVQIPGVAVGSHAFSLKIVNGKPAFRTNSKASAFDLMMVLSENDLTREWLLGKTVTINLDSSYKMSISKMPDEVVAAQEPATA